MYFYLFFSSVVVFLILAVLFKKRCDNLKDRLYSIFLSYSELRYSNDDLAGIRKEFYDLSWNGKSPWRVICLGKVIAVHTEKKFISWSYIHMTSVCYSQIKHALRKGWLPSALVFLNASRRMAYDALIFWEAEGVAGKNAIDLEVIGAPDFLLATLPFIGGIWKKDACMYLLSAREFTNNNSPEKEATSPVGRCLILSKLYRLTRDGIYLAEMRKVMLGSDVDQNQLARVARHVGHKDPSTFLSTYFG